MDNQPISVISVRPKMICGFIDLLEWRSPGRASRVGSWGLVVLCSVGAGFFGFPGKGVYSRCTERNSAEGKHSGTS
jgi:hypothetical protein